MKKGQRLIQGLMVLTVCAVLAMAVPLTAQAKEKVFKWQPSSWLSSGISWDTINDISKKVTQKPAAGWS